MGFKIIFVLLQVTVSKKKEIKVRAVKTNVTCLISNELISIKNCNLDAALLCHMPVYVALHQIQGEVLSFLQVIIT